MGDRTGLKAKSGNRHRVTTPNSRYRSFARTHSDERFGRRRIRTFRWPRRMATEAPQRIHLAHLADKVALIDLANIAKLSPFHFARAFKRSLGDPRTAISGIVASRSPKRSSKVPLTR